MSEISIKIEGDYINSFVYRGYVVLIKTSGEVLSLRWNDLVDKSVDNAIYKFMLKNFNSEKNKKTDNCNYFLDEGFVKKFKIDSFSIDYWPSDVTIYANSIYICGEYGVDAIPMNFDNGNIHSENKIRIYDKRAYKISANDWRRVAIAAGENGVLLRSISQYGVSGGREIEVESNDCEWIDTNLIVNSNGNAKINVFKKQISYAEFKLLDKKQKNDFYERIMDDLGQENGHDYSWGIGNKVFSLNGNSVVKNEILASEDRFDVKKVFDERLDFIGCDKLISVKSGSFGSIFETKDKLYLLNDEKKVELLDDDFVGWKVFPRARSFSNSLHIIKDDFLSIKVFTGDQAYSNKFGAVESEIL